MKRFIIFILSILIAFAGFATVNVALAKNNCPCKQQKHKVHKKPKKSACYRRYYVEGYCECTKNPCSCQYEKSCYSGRYVYCRTEFYYHHGRNTSSVEVCD